MLWPSIVSVIPLRCYLGDILINTWYACICRLFHLTHYLKIDEVDSFLSAFGFVTNRIFLVSLFLLNAPFLFFNASQLNCL